MRLRSTWIILGLKRWLVSCWMEQGYVDNRLLKDRSPVRLHRLLWWLPGVLYAVDDYLGTMGLVHSPVPLGSSVLLTSGESMDDAGLRLVAPPRLWCSVARNLIELEREWLEGGLLVSRSNARLYGCRRSRSGPLVVDGNVSEADGGMEAAGSRVRLVDPEVP